MNPTSSSHLPPPLPPPLRSTKKLVITAYIFSALTFIPLLGFLFGIIGIALGVRLCAKGENGHGAANIALSAALLFVAIPVLVITVLTLLGEQLKEVFQQVTTQLGTQSQP